MEVKGKAAKQYRVNLVIQLAQSGHSQKQIISITGLSQSRVSQILIQSRQSESHSVEIQSPPGRKPGLTADQLGQLSTLLKAEALKSGFATDGWTLKRIAQVIERHFGKSYSLEHVRRLLKKMGFTRQRPKAQDFRHNKQAVETWKETDLPALKKSQE